MFMEKHSFRQLVKESIRDGIVFVLRQEKKIDDLNARIELLRESRNQQAASVEALHARVQELLRENRVLKGLA